MPDAPAAHATRVRVTTADGIARVVLDSPPLNILTQGLLAELRAALAALAADADAARPRARRRGQALLGRRRRRRAPAAGLRGDDPRVRGDRRGAAGLPRAGDRRGARPLPRRRLRAGAGRGPRRRRRGRVVRPAGDRAGRDRPGRLRPAARRCAGRRAPRRCSSPGTAITAAQALAMGLVARVSADDRVDEEALALAGRIARHSAAALRVAKRAAAGGERGPRDRRAARRGPALRGGPDADRRRPRGAHGLPRRSGPPCGRTDERRHDARRRHLPGVARAAAGRPARRVPRPAGGRHLPHGAALARGRRQGAGPLPGLLPRGDRARRRPAAVQGARRAGRADAGRLPLRLVPLLDREDVARAGARAAASRWRCSSRTRSATRRATSARCGAATSRTPARSSTCRRTPTRPTPPRTCAASTTGCAAASRRSPAVR